jgi:hypothetical protein
MVAESRPFYYGAQRGAMKTGPIRLDSETSVRVERFEPWWLRCAKCSRRAKAWPNWEERVAQCKCEFCGAVYKVAVHREGWPKAIQGVPLWFKKGFRGRTFWALNDEHLAYLKRVIEAQLREQPVSSGKRIMQNQSMPGILPAWLLSAKNRPDLLRLIARLENTLQEA